MNYMLLITMIISSILICTQGIQCYQCTENSFQFSSGSTSADHCNETTDITECPSLFDRCTTTNVKYSVTIGGTGVTMESDMVMRYCETSYRLLRFGGDPCEDFKGWEDSLRVQGMKVISFNCEGEACDSDACNSLGQDKF